MIVKMEQANKLKMQSTNSQITSDLIASRSIDIEDCKSVCLALGPYRNLTTLTASTLFLHPDCQVLNHAGKRIYENDEVDFLSNYSKERFNRFVQFAIHISGGGKRGNFGGSIIHSHAFDSVHEMKTIFSETEYELIKNQIRCLFWKESLSTSNLIREKHIDLKYILSKEERLRFLMPIRNPLDCAISNLKTGHVNRFRGLDQRSKVSEVLLAILKEIHWFASHKKNHPDRFFYYFEHSIDREMLLKLASFLSLDADEDWISRALRVMVNKSSYQHNPDLLAFYRKCVEQQFAQFPALAEQLLIFANNIDGSNI